ncbi:MAG TPA: PatB family C-S lyase [Candidatus Dormibacteraeota bacterium]|nr:PatB family C-S lyase [Candidatus Dormibacteraeota bacterium]
MTDFLLSAAELRERGGGKWRRYPPDVLPAFVADCDFKVAPAVQAALRRFVDRQDYGYGSWEDVDALYAAFVGWMQRRHGWAADPKLTLPLADVVQGIVAVQVAYSAPGDGVLVQTPAYPPFLRTVASSRRRLVENPLRDTGERFEIDFEALDSAAGDARVLLFCSPHNPTGRVFTREELERVVEVARRHDLLIVSDEIHADIVFPGARHIAMETVAGAAERTVTLTSATKSFNIPGTRAAVVHFGTEELRDRFAAALPDHLLGHPSRFGSDATIAAWTESEAWLDEVLRYLAQNRETVRRWAAATPGVRHHVPEATFLSWLDCRELDLPGSPYEFFLESAHVGLADGADFAAPGFVRLNFGTSAEILEEILDRMTRALNSDMRA